MPEYRLYPVDTDGHFAGMEAFIADEDAAAIEKAERLADGRHVELWSGPRLVTVLKNNKKFGQDDGVAGNGA
jgi:hypothetical protein